MRRWKLEDAKNGFSELVRLARADGPQLVTKNGRDAVVVLSAEEYAGLSGSEGLVEFLQNSPLAEAIAAGDLELDRPRDLGRSIEL